MSYKKSYSDTATDFLYYEGSNDGSAVVFDAADIGNCSVAKLSDSSFVVGYQDGTDGNLIAASVSDTTPTFGSKVQVTANNVSFVDVVALTSTSGIMIYHDTTASDTKAAGFTVSGTTVTAGTPVQIDTVAGATKPNIKRISDTVALATWQAGGASEVIALSLSGTTVTAGSSQVTNASSEGVSCIALSSSLGLAAFIDNGATNTARVVAFTISGTTLGTPGTEQQVGTGGSGSTTAIIPLTSTTAAVLSTNQTTDTIEYSLISVSGTTITVSYTDTFATIGNPLVLSCETLSTGVSAILNPVASSEGGITGIKRNPLYNSNIVFGKLDRTMGISAVNSDICLLTGSKAVVVYDDGASGGKAIVTKVS